MYTSIQIPEKNISGSTWNVEASAVQKWNGEAVAGAGGGHAPSRPVTYYKFYIVGPKLAQIYFVPEYFFNYSSNTKNCSGTKKFCFGKKVVIGPCAMV